jgi:signal peptidase I
MTTAAPRRRRFASGACVGLIDVAACRIANLLCRHHLGIWRQLGKAEHTMTAAVTTRARRVFDEVKGLALTCGLMLVAGTAIGQPFIVPSGSMEPTLMIGDEIAAAKYAYGYGRYSSPVGVIPLKGRILERPPERGDIVVFALPRDPAQTYVKRVIGLPGDRIQMKGGLLFINGAEVPRRPVGPVTMTVGGSRVRGMKYVETLPNGRVHDIMTLGGSPLDDTPVFAVPADSYFMMGDNRDNSLDSRVDPEAGGVGFVPADNLIGRVDRVLFSISPHASWLDVLADPVDLRVSRLLHAVQ